MKTFKEKNGRRRVESMSSQEKANIIKRLERERSKINSEIESILKSYAKESGNRALLPKRMVFGLSEELFTSYEE